MSNQRIYGLDTWRAGLLLVGPIIHTVQQLELSGHLYSTMLDGLPRASALFRMPVFFFIAGFLAAHAQTKQTGWLLRRSLQLGIPLISTWLLVLTPVRLISKAAGSSDLLDPEYLWFVIDLLLFTWGFWHLSSIRSVSSGFVQCRSGNLIIWFVSLSTILASLRFPIHHLSGSGIITVFLDAPTYAIFYFGGFVVQRNPDLFTFLQKKAVTFLGPVLIFPAFMFVEAIQPLLRVPHEHYFLKGIASGITGFTGALICCAVLASAVSIGHRSRIMSRLSRASYSVYLLHFPVILLTAPMLCRLNVSVYSTFCLLAATSLGVSWAVHELLIQRIPLLSFLFNGTRAHGESTRAPRRSIEQAVRLELNQVLRRNR